MKIRRAVPGDRFDLVRLREMMLEQVIGGPLAGEDREIMEEFFLKWDYQDPLCLVAEEHGSILGCIAVSYYQTFPSPKNPSGLQAHLYNFAVYEEHRRRGIGWTLFAHVLRECRERGVGRISLYATEMGRSVYEHFGFSSEVIICPEMRLYHHHLERLEL